MTIPDPISAVRVYLRAAASVTAVVPAAQIYAGEMPATEATAQPRAAVVISASGGSPDRGYALLGRTRLDVRAYGATPADAARVSYAVHESLKALTRTRVTGGTPAITPTLLHSVVAETGPTALRDADGKWPLVIRVYELLAAEIAA